MKFIFSLIVLVITAKECGKNKTPLDNAQTNNTSQTQQPSGTYYIQSIKGNNTLPLNLKLTFNKKSNKISGFSGCNHFSGTYTIIKDSIAFSKLISSKMYCKKTQEIENLILKYLSKINIFSLQENKLLLKNGDINLLTAHKDSIKEVKNDMVLVYTTFSRGGIFKTIQIENNAISVQKNRNYKTITQPLSNEDRNNLINLFETINLKNLSNLKAPTQARLHDGADIANLKVIYKGVIYEVPSFDHGTPAKEIQALVEEILSVSKNIEKQ